MREHDRHKIDHRRPSGPPRMGRVGADGRETEPPACVPERLAGEVIRLARLATAIHLYESVRLITSAEGAPERAR